MLAPSRAPTDRSAEGESTLSSWTITRWGSYWMRAPESSARTRYSVSSPEDQGPTAPRPSCSSNSPTRSTTDRRRKIVNEIARFQRFCRVRSVESLAHDAVDCPSSPIARPVRPSSSGSMANRRATRSSRSGAKTQSSSGNMTSPARIWPSAAFRAWESPRGARSRTTSSAGWLASIRSRRSSSFWSTSMTRNAACVCASREFRSRPSCSTRSTVATTRSNDGSSPCATAIR